MGLIEGFQPGHYLDRLFADGYDLGYRGEKAVWSLDPERFGERIGVSERYSTALMSAETYFVTGEICSILWDSLDSLPKFPLTAAHIPSLFGFTYLSSPKEVMDHATAELLHIESASPKVPVSLDLRAVSWELGQQVDPVDGVATKDLLSQSHCELGEHYGTCGICGQRHLNSLEVTFWAESPELRKRYVGLGPISRVRWSFDEKLSWAEEDWGDIHSGAAPEYVHVICQCRKFLVSFLCFIQQKLCSRERIPLPRSTRRRAARWQVPSPDINVITLRRRVYPVNRPEGAGLPVDWSCRWIVRGHWRDQFYPSRGLHIPIFIESYIKGPDGKPIKKPGIPIFNVAR